MDHTQAHREFDIRGNKDKDSMQAISNTIDASLLLRLEIEEFLNYEASLIDDRRFGDWANLLADDLEYWMPVRTTRSKGDEAEEFAPLGAGAFFDERKEHIEERIRKLETPYSWSEDPPSRTRHFNANIRVVGQPSPNEVEVSVNFILYRGRLANHEDWWVGRRLDGVRRTPDGWRLYKRHIFMDQVSLLAKNLSVFF